MKMNTVEAAKEIRKSLKAIGISSRQVSVRSDVYSLGSSIDVTVKTLAVRLSVVREIAERYSRVSRCEISGEILSGGNRFVDVEYSREALEPARALVHAQLPKEIGDSAVIGGWTVLRSDRYDYRILGRTDEERDAVAYGPESAAHQLALKMAEDGLFAGDITPAELERPAVNDVEDPQAWILTMGA